METYWHLDLFRVVLDRCLAQTCFLRLLPGVGRRSLTTTSAAAGLEALELRLEPIVPTLTTQARACAGGKLP